MVTKSPARDGSLAVLQLAAAPRDDEASGVAFLLCLTRMDLSKSSLDALPFLDNHISPSVVCVINRQNIILKYGTRGHFRYNNLVLSPFQIISHSKNLEKLIFFKFD